MIKIRQQTQNFPLALVEILGTRAPTLKAKDKVILEDTKGNRMELRVVRKYGEVLILAPANKSGAAVLWDIAKGLVFGSVKLYTPVGRFITRGSSACRTFAELSLILANYSNEDAMEHMEAVPLNAELRMELLKQLIEIQQSIVDNLWKYCERDRWKLPNYERALKRLEALRDLFEKMALQPE